MNRHSPSLRSETIEAFATRLQRLRDEAGAPPFRTMAKRSGCISHTTMHDAVQGVRLPSWQTTAEFAKACQVDPAALREEWVEAAAIVRRAEPDLPAERPPVIAAEVVRASPPDTDGPPMSARKVAALSAVASAVVTLSLVGAFQVITRGPSGTSEARATQTPPVAALASVAAPVKGSCPSNTAQHSSQPPRDPRDGGLFLGDVTVQDCSTQPRGTWVVKTWRLKNNGSLVWQGRSLRRIDPLIGQHGCDSPEETPIPKTLPGESVDVSVRVRTPNNDATCFTRWMMADPDGRYSFPGQRPYFFSFFVR